MWFSFTEMFYISNPYWVPVGGARSLYSTSLIGTNLYRLKKQPTCSKCSDVFHLQMTELILPGRPERVRAKREKKGCDRKLSRPVALLWSFSVWAEIKRVQIHQQPLGGPVSSCDVWGKGWTITTSLFLCFSRAHFRQSHLFGLFVIDLLLCGCGRWSLILPVLCWCQTKKL